MQEDDVPKFEQRLAPFGGVVEWWTPHGLGIRFDGSTLTDGQLASLEDVLPHVVWMNLSDTLITDKGLRHLANATCLEDIRLGSCISVDGVRGLLRLSKLATVNLDNVIVSTNDVEKLRQANPQVQIERNRS